MYILMPIVFLLGILAIALEDVIHVNKAASALATCLLLWAMFLIDSLGILSAHPNDMLMAIDAHFPNFAALPFSQKVYMFMERAILTSLGDVSETLFFVLGSMVIIELVDAHGGFSVITEMIHSDSKRVLLWILSFVTFFLSAFVGDLATIIVMLAVMHKLVPERADRLIYASMAVIAANAGGAFSPIGDVTTLLLWTGDNVSASHLITHVFPSSLTMLVLPLCLATFMFPKNAKVAPLTAAQREADRNPSITPKVRKVVFTIGVLSLIMVPVFQTLIELPAFMGVLLGLTVLWIYTDILYRHNYSLDAKNLRVPHIISRIDITTVLYFLGILMAVAALNKAGQLADLSTFLNQTFPSPEWISIVLGVCSSFLDNVALVAGAIGMYPVTEAGAFMLDGTFWTFLAFCAVTGGSILIIGSASGVTAMGIEKISFTYYLKRFTPLALIGYAGGALVYLLLF